MRAGALARARLGQRERRDAQAPVTALKKRPTLSQWRTWIDGAELTSRVQPSVWLGPEGVDVILPRAAPLPIVRRAAQRSGAYGGRQSSTRPGAGFDVGGAFLAQGLRRSSHVIVQAVGKERMGRLRVAAPPTQRMLLLLANSAECLSLLSAGRASASIVVQEGCLVDHMLPFTS